LRHGDLHDQPRASIFTGQHEKVDGVSGFQKPLPPEVFANTYPALMRKAGCRTGFIGKFGLGRRSARR
jgi:arylsulfatase A-like enzyme